MEVAKKHGMLGDKREERINYRQAMLAYEKAGVFSYAQNVAQILGDKEMEQVYHDIIRYVK
jgi:adenylate kinase family enzyme